MRCIWEIDSGGLAYRLEVNRRERGIKMNDLKAVYCVIG